MTTVAEAVEYLSTTYDTWERALACVECDPVEVQTALAAAEPDTVEYVCLQQLAIAFPAPPAPAPTTRRRTTAPPSE